MAILKNLPVSDAHLLCLMEVWFDRTQSLVEALAAFKYCMLGNSKVACPFCHIWYDEEESRLILNNIVDFEHGADCPTIAAQQLMIDMLLR